VTKKLGVIVVDTLGGGDTGGCPFESGLGPRENSLAAFSFFLYNPYMRKTLTTLAVIGVWVAAGVLYMWSHRNAFKKDNS